MTKAAKRQIRDNDEIGYLTEFAQGMIAPVHMWGADIRTGWYACEHPEKPTDAWVMWHYEDGADCQGCRIAASALLMRHPDDSHVQWLAARFQEKAA